MENKDTRNLDYFREQGVPDSVINFSAREKEAERAAQSALVQEDLDLYMGHVWRQRFAAIGLGAGLGAVGGVINLITEPALTTGVAALLSFPAAIVGISHLLVRNQNRVNDHIYDWSGNWNDGRRTREHAREIAANSWEFAGGLISEKERKTDRYGRPVIVLDTGRGEIITHNIEHVRRP